MWIEAHEDTGRDDMVDRITHHYARAAQLVAEVGAVPGVPADVADVACAWVERAAVRAEQGDFPIVAERLYSEGLRLLGGHLGSPHRRFLTGRARTLSEQRELAPARSDEHTSELQSLMRTSYAVVCSKKKKLQPPHQIVYTADHEIS